MLSNFRSWYMRNYDAITWFLIGFLVMGGLSDLGKGNLVGSILLFGIAFLNYIFVRK